VRPAASRPGNVKDANSAVGGPPSKVQDVGGYMWAGGRKQDVFPVNGSWCAAGRVRGEKTSSETGLDPGTGGVWPRAMATGPSGHGL
jgi:hypothetical protein